MPTFQLDQLFGLALTDDRFFRQLQKVPKEAIAKFDLTESEEEAVLDIAPAVHSVEELAIRLEAWRVCARDALAEAPAENRFANLNPTVWRLSPTKSTQAEIIPASIIC